MATIGIDQNRITIDGKPHERRAVLQLSAAGPRKHTDLVTMPLNLLSWHQLTEALPVAAHEYSQELLGWRANELRIIAVGAAVNARDLETWEAPDMWEWQAQAKARLDLGSCAIFDDRGMGKTRSTIEAIRASRMVSEEHAVVVCGKRLRGVWKAATEMWWASDKVCLPTGKTWSEAADQVGDAPITVLTYDSLFNDDIHKAVTKLDPEWLIIDEAHNLKKRNRKDR